MDKDKFIKLLKAAQLNDSVSWDSGLQKPHIDVLRCIYSDIEKFPHYTFDGRLEDILVKLLKDSKYVVEGYSEFLKDLNLEFERLIVTNVILLPLNFLDGSKFKEDTKLNESMRIFLQTKSDLKRLSDFELLRNQEKNKKKNESKTDDNLNEYFRSIIGSNLDKEHILLAKDRHFFNFPILTIEIQNVDAKVEMESGRIVEAIYAFIRMLDFREKYTDYGWGLVSDDLPEPAHTYVVYYNDYRKFNQKIEDSHYGHSLRYNFSPYLDINTEVFIKHLNRFEKLTNAFINSCFLDKRTISEKDLKIVNKWKNAVLMFNTAYEFAANEKYDSTILIMMSLLESLLIQNEGRNKKDKLIEKVKVLFIGTYNDKQMKETISSLENVYKTRNKYSHEGLGYESEFTYSRRLHDYQGMYPGMKPFKHNGAFHSYSDLKDISNIFDLIIDILSSDDTIKNLPI